MVAYKYVVHSDVDENNIRDEFETANDAIEYAKSYPLEDKVWVELVEVELNDFGEVEDVYDHETIWSYADETSEEVDDDFDFSVDDLADDNKPEFVDEDYIIAVKEVPNSDDFDGIDWADVDSCEADNYECCSEDEECEWPEPTSDISIVAKPSADPVNFVDDFSMDFPEAEKTYCPNCGKEICECSKQELTEADEESVEDEIPDDFEGQMDYLSASEEKAIDEYEAVIDKIEDEHVAGELEKIATEEEAHKEFVNAVKEDPTAEYVEPLETEEKEEEVFEDEEEDFEECLKEAFSGEELSKLMELAPQVGIKTLGDLDAYMKKNNISEDELLGFMEAEIAKSDVPVDEFLNEGIFDNFKIDKQAKKLTDKESCYYVKVVTDGNVDETNSKYFTKIADADKYAKAAAKKFAQADVKIYLNNEAWLNTPLKGYKGNDTIIDQVERAINQIAQQKAEADAKVKQDKQAEKEANKIEKQFSKAAGKSVEAKKEKEVNQQEVKPEVKDELVKDTDTSTNSEVNTASTEQTTSSDVKQETEVKPEEVKPEPEVKKNAAAVKASAEYNKILKALKAANIDTTKFVDGKKATQELKDLRKALFSEGLDYNSMQEALEENEDEVECRGCYELFPKSSCVKTKHGYYCEACASSLKEELTEHINDRPADIESDKELQGMDNAVVDCQTDFKVIAHSEDEKPLDCKMKKAPLEKPLTEEQNPEEYLYGVICKLAGNNSETKVNLNDLIYAAQWDDAVRYFWDKVNTLEEKGKIKITWPDPEKWQKAYCQLVESLAEEKSLNENSQDEYTVEVDNWIIWAIGDDYQDAITLYFDSKPALKDILNKLDDGVNEWDDCWYNEEGEEDIELENSVKANWQDDCEFDYKIIDPFGKIIEKNHYPAYNKF